MSYETENVFMRRQQLAGALTEFSNLLQTIKAETLNNTELTDTEKRIFYDRLKIFTELSNAICNYDIAVKLLEHKIKQSGDAEYYRQQLEVARRYVRTLGGDWQTVVWGKISDY